MQRFIKIKYINKTVFSLDKNLLLKAKQKTKILQSPAQLQMTNYR